MTGRRPAWLAVVIGTIAFALAAAALHARDTSSVSAPAANRRLYVQSGSLAARLCLSFDAVAADVYWARAIQYYGRERRLPPAPDRFALLEPLIDLTTTLDPKFNIAYRFGAILLAEERPNGPGRPDRAVALLEKGLRTDPARWQYAHDIGFIHYFHGGRFDEAARWFRRAAAMPGAPAWLEPLAAVTLARGGDRQGARRLLTGLLTNGEGYIRQSAERGLAQLQALDDLDRLQALVDAYRARNGTYPRTLAEATGSHPPAAERDPTGRPYVYDEAAGTVRLAADSALAPLPGAFTHR